MLFLRFFLNFLENGLFWTIYSFGPIRPLEQIKKNECFEVDLESAKDSLQN